MDSLATFRLFGPGPARASSVTERLGLVPSRACEVGERPRSRGPVRSTACWGLSSAPEAQRGAELADQLVVLLDLLEPRAEELWRLVGEGWEANWFCYLGSYAAEHAAELSRDVLSRLLALPEDMWLDVYGTDPEDEA